MTVDLVTGFERLDFDAVPIRDLRRLFDALGRWWSIERLHQLSQHRDESWIEAEYRRMDAAVASGPVDVGLLVSAIDAGALQDLTPAELRRIGGAIFRWADAATIRRYLRRRRPPKDLDAQCQQTAARLADAGVPPDASRREARAHVPFRNDRWADIQKHLAAMPNGQG